MGVAWGDIDGDQDFDLVITDFWAFPPLPRGNPLLLAEDGALSADRCAQWLTCTGQTGWPAAFQDFDRDGWVDLFVGTSGTGLRNDLLFRNAGGSAFHSVEIPALERQDSRGGATADYDGDGAMDLFLWGLISGGSLLRNAALDDHGWVSLRLEGDGIGSHPEAIGAIVTLTTDAGTQVRAVHASDSAHSRSERAVHFGVPLGSTITGVEVRWPDGRLEALGPIAADRFHRVAQGVGVVPEGLVTAAARWTGTAVEVSARTDYGGRTALALEGLGALTWDPDATAFVASLPLASPPATVVVASERGGRWTVPVGGP